MIDFDTSSSISGTKSVEELGKSSWIIWSVCNGEEVKAEINNISDMAINQFYKLCINERRIVL